MSYTPELVAELDVLRQFNLENLQEGLKVHHEASPATIAAFGRLHAKGLITQADGGYLTSLGRDAAEQRKRCIPSSRKPSRPEIAMPFRFTSPGHG